MIEFNKTFGAAQTAQGYTGIVGTRVQDQPKARFWLNIGYSVPGTKEGDDDRFVSLPLGVPVDTQEHVSIQSRNVEYSQFQQARNDLLDQIIIFTFVDFFYTFLQMFALRRDIFTCETSCQKTYHRMGNTGRTSYRTASAAYAVEGFLCTFFKFASLCICDVLHYI